LTLTYLTLTYLTKTCAPAALYPVLMSSKKAALTGRLF
jgi:hypothetical protein